MQLVMSLSVKDRRVLFDFKFLLPDHCNFIENKAYILANMLLRCFHSRDRILLIKLSNTCVRVQYLNLIALFDLHILLKTSIPLNGYKKFSPRG